MAVPTSLADLNTTISSNSPAGTDLVAATLDDYLRAHAGLIAQVNARFPTGMTLRIVTDATTTAVASEWLILTNVGTTTVTLPGSPASGNKVWITVGNALETNVVARNGKKIQGAAADLTIDDLTVSGGTVKLTYATGSSFEWVVTA